MARRVPTVGHCFGFFPTIDNWDAKTFEFHMDKGQALEFATVLLAAMQHPDSTIRVTVFRTQKSKSGAFPIQIQAAKTPRRPL